MILIIAGNCVGDCHYLHDFILCLLALHGFASKITIICLILKVSQQKKIAKCLLLLGGTLVVSCTTGRFCSFQEQVLSCHVLKADDLHHCSYDSDPGMLVHLHDISSPIPLSRPIFNSEWIMFCKNILYVDSWCKSSYLCSRPFLSKSNLNMRPQITGFSVQGRCRHCCFVRLSTLSAHCFENTTSHVNFDIQRTKLCENVRDLE